MSDTKVIFKLKNLNNLNKIQHLIQKLNGVNEVVLSDDKINANINSHKIKPVMLGNTIIEHGYHLERITTTEI